LSLELLAFTFFFPCALCGLCVRQLFFTLSYFRVFVIVFFFDLSSFSLELSASSLPGLLAFSLSALSFQLPRFLAF
jgi:hypothetical protein